MPANGHEIWLEVGSGRIGKNTAIGEFRDARREGRDIYMILSDTSYEPHGRFHLIPEKIEQVLTTRGKKAIAKIFSDKEAEPFSMEGDNQLPGPAFDELPDQNRVIALHQDARKLSIKPGSVDRIFASNLFGAPYSGMDLSRHVPIYGADGKPLGLNPNTTPLKVRALNREQAVREMVSALKPGGIIKIDEYISPPEWMPLDELRQLFLKHGLEVAIFRRLEKVRLPDGKHAGFWKTLKHLKNKRAQYVWRKGGAVMTPMMGYGSPAEYAKKYLKGAPVTKTLGKVFNGFVMIARKPK